MFTVNCLFCDREIEVPKAIRELMIESRSGGYGALHDYQEQCSLVCKCRKIKQGDKVKIRNSEGKYVTCIVTGLIQNQYLVYVTGVAKNGEIYCDVLSEVVY